MPTLFNLSFRLNSRAGEDGLTLVMLRIFRRGDKNPVYLSTGVRVMEKHFNPSGNLEKSNWVRTGSARAHQHNASLATFLQRAMDVAEFLEKSPATRPSSALLKQYIEGGDPSDLLEYARRVVFPELIASGRYASLRHHETALSHLKGFGHQTLPVGTITPAFLRDFIKYLKAKPKNAQGEPRSGESIYQVLVSLQGLYHEYHRYHEQATPLDPFKIVRPSQVEKQPVKEKVDLTLDELSRLAALKLDPQRKTVNLFHLRNAYLLLYACQGMRVGDLLLLERKQVWRVTDEGTGLFSHFHVDYRQHKNRFSATGGHMKLDVAPFAAPIVQYYLDNARPGQQKLMPYFEEYKGKTLAELTPLNILRRVDRIITGMDRNFPRLTALAGIEKKITMHTSRRTYATHAYEELQDIRHVQLSLGHGKSEQTEIYIGAQRQRVIERNRQVYEKRPIALVLESAET